MLPPTWLSGALQWPLWASACCLGLLVCLLSLHVVEKLWVAHKSGQNMVKEQPTATADKALARFQRQYLVVYGLVMFADWLQGTHMYSLYQVRTVLDNCRRSLIILSSIDWIVLLLDRATV